EARRSRSAGRQVVDAELDGDDGAREAHHRRLPVDFEERGQLPVGKALADEQRQADGHLRKAAPHAEDARGGGDGEEPASAAEQFVGVGPTAEITIYVAWTGFVDGYGCSEAKSRAEFVFDRARSDRGH